MSKAPTNSALRQFISQHFNVPELTSFCFNYFPEIGDEFPPDMPKSLRVELLIGYCQRRSLIPNLLTALVREREKPYKQTFPTSNSPKPLPQHNASEPTLTSSFNSHPSSLPKEDDNLWLHPITGKEMVRVPAGIFLYGEDKWSMHLDEFWIDKTLVTNADYKRFIDANPNYRVPFVDADWAKPYNWNKQYRTFRHEMTDHPVVLVSWHDAQAYAKWAEADLPSEQQWEKAARGTDGRIYPWGYEDWHWQDKHCNTSESGIDETTPVGQFSPRGESPYGCLDMSGNVWEWTDSLALHNKYERVIRGGSFLDSLLAVECHSQWSSNVNFCEKNIGFRTISRHSLFLDH
ncbi:MAG: SUMF1/EgtB/PvdO family nonheme iron enzyme [Anaerolineae bacterium]|nr:SUMF1/EgtB/PvdO family nonheme iron enzyme [Anaerolineae bacterium]